MASGTAKFAISPVRSPADLAAVVSLFHDYAASLPIDLSYQNFDAELATLPGKYAPPDGALLVARGDGASVRGCVGLRAMSAAGCCEMKRLFIVPNARGLGLGRALAEAIIETARRARYADLRLDTLPTMKSAIRLYGHMGFKPTGPYYAPTPPGTVFMTLKL